MGNKSVQVGVKAKDLEERGVEYESAGIAPKLPDYLGYVFGLLLVWLVYTGYQSAVVAMKKPINKISEHAVTLKNKVDDFTTDDATKAIEANSTKATTLVKTEIIKKKKSTSWWSKLDRVNTGISRAVEYTAGTVQSWFFEDDFDDVVPRNSSDAPVGTRARPKREKVSENGEELEWF